MPRRASSCRRSGSPTDEDFEFELVTEKRWLGYARYLGGLRTHISVNTDLPVLVSVPSLST